MIDPFAVFMDLSRKPVSTAEQVLLVRLHCVYVILNRNESSTRILKTPNGLFNWDGAYRWLEKMYA